MTCIEFIRILQKKSQYCDFVPTRRIDLTYYFSIKDTDIVVAANTSRIYFSIRNEHSLSIGSNGTIIYSTFSGDNAEFHSWSNEQLSEEEYFQQSTIDPNFTLSYNENKQINILVDTVRSVMYGSDL